MLLLVANGSAGNREVLCEGLPATIIGTEGPDRLEGTPGPDVIVGLGGDDIIRGGGGDDRICGGAGLDELFGEAGNDRVFGEGDRDILSGGDGDDLLDVGEGSTDAAYGEQGNDRLVGNGLSVIAYLSAPGPVRVDLGAGTSSGADGNDTFSGFIYVIGSNFDDELIGNNQLNIFIGLRGNDTFRGGGGFDVVLFTAGPVNASLVTGRSAGPEEGNDTLVDIHGLAAQDGNDTLIGDSRDNFIVGNGGDDTLRGGGGADTLLGGPGDDHLFGDAGNDFLRGGPGRNVLDGGAGADDQATYSDLASLGRVGMDVDLAAHYAVGPGIEDTLRNVEAVVGSEYGDVLEGDDIGNALSGGGGDDTLRGRGGNDFLDGGTGDDTADGGAGTKDYCLNAERSVRCEFVRKTQSAFAGSKAVLAVLADMPIDAMIESQSEPTCKPFAKGGGEISIAPPKRIKVPGANDTARWRAELFRQGSNQPVATTPLAEGILSAPGLERGVPAVWTNPRTHAIVGRVVKRVTRPGVYYWKASVELVRLGPVGSGTLHAYHSPPGTASALPTCDLRGKD